MSKVSNPLGQSMASLFTPESERLAAARKKQEGSAAPKANGMRIPGMPGIQSHKSGDSLGNPNSPGYEPWGKKKGAEQEQAAEERSTPAPGGRVIETTAQGPEIIRLSVGWEKLLLVQKKLCEKAKGIFVKLEGPPTYTEQKKAKLQKSRGCIVDLDLQETAEQKQAEAKAQEEKKTA